MKHYEISIASQEGCCTAAGKPITQSYMQPVVNDDKKFAVSLDVLKFRPEVLNVHLNGRQLTIEGNQEHKSENTFITSHGSLQLYTVPAHFRSFLRKWIFPENINLEAIQT
ncbi:unnamed protein product [Angiostrongylus costaricensis]|uniref:SHSP domain-containing protein n=1 Tax=Angiostrongylus costaricensis TaxID=334426 RepID=A0A0R3PXG0_ANGCS|nr:unnamed protein product [Angiostrongylus costaricensis]